MTRKFCPVPFTDMRIGWKGMAKTCCPAWVKGNSSYIGTVGKKSLNEIWNSKQARDFRQSIHDNTFKYCDKENCLTYQGLNDEEWFLQKGGVLAEIIAEKQTSVRSPENIALNYDASCTLSCPMCRVNKIMAMGEEYEKLKNIHDQVVSELDSPKHLIITGAGDAFGSKIYRDYLANFDSDRFPDVKLTVRTNADLLNKKMWSYIAKSHKNIQRVMISLDAVKKESYETMRRGARHDRMLENMNFVSQLRKLGEIPFVSLHFAIQLTNYTEIFEIIEFSKKWGVDLISFTHLFPGGELVGDKHLENAVHLPKHRNFNDFCSIMAIVPTEPELVVYTPSLIDNLPKSIKERFYKNLASPNGAEGIKIA